MKKICLIQFIYLFALINPITLFSQITDDIPEIYKGSDHRCMGSILMKYQKNRDSEKFKNELKWIQDNCNSNGTEVDSDKDGVPDSEDSCPQEFGTDNGCPEKITSSPKATPIIGNPNGTVCYKWGIAMKQISDSWQFNFCEVEELEEGCYCKSNSLRPLGIPDFSRGEISSNKVIRIAIEKKNKNKSLKGLLPISLTNQYSRWADEKTNTQSQYDFIMVVLSNTGVWSINNTKTTKIQGLDSRWFLKEGQELVEAVALLHYHSSSFKIWKYPKDGNLKMVVSGKYLGKKYLVGLDKNGHTYFPIRPTEKSITEKLVNALVSEQDSQLKPPLRALVNNWYYEGSRNYIITCIEGGQPSKYPNPNEAWNSGVKNFSGSYSPNLTFILNDGKIVKNNLKKDLKVEWYYRVKNLKNPYLAMIAVTDPETRILGVNQSKRKLALLSGNPDNLYILHVPEGDEKPKVKSLFQLPDKGGSRKLVEALTKSNQLKPPLRQLVREWIDLNRERQIIACVENGKPDRYANPKQAWASGVQQFSGGTTDKLNFILEDGEVIGPSFSIQAPWYDSVKHLENAHLMMLAVADPETSILDIYNNRIILITGNPDNIYVLKINRNDRNQPKVKRVIDEKKLPSAFRGQEARKCKDKTYYITNYKHIARAIDFDE